MVLDAVEAAVLADAAIAVRNAELGTAWATLYYPDPNDTLPAEAWNAILAGDRDKVWESTDELYSDILWEATYLKTNELIGKQYAALRDEHPDEYERVLEHVRDTDETDPVQYLIEHTYGIPVHLSYKPDEDENFLYTDDEEEPRVACERIVGRRLTPGEWEALEKAWRDAYVGGHIHLVGMVSPNKIVKLREEGVTHLVVTGGYLGLWDDLNSGSYGYLELLNGPTVFDMETMTIQHEDAWTPSQGRLILPSRSTYELAVEGVKFLEKDTPETRQVAVDLIAGGTDVKTAMDVARWGTKKTVKSRAGKGQSATKVAKHSTTER